MSSTGDTGKPALDNQNDTSQLIQQVNEFVDSETDFDSWQSSRSTTIMDDNETEQPKPEDFSSSGSHSNNPDEKSKGENLGSTFSKEPSTTSIKTLFRCNNCAQSFRTILELKRHKDKPCSPQRQEVQNSDEPLEKSASESSGRISDSDDSTEKEQTKINLCYACEYCQRSYFSKSKLMRHKQNICFRQKLLEQRRKQHMELPTNFQRESLLYHSRRESTQDSRNKAYRNANKVNCPDCEKFFAKGSLKSHQTWHCPAQGPFDCKTCKARCKSKLSFLKHRELYCKSANDPKESKAIFANFQTSETQTKNVTHSGDSNKEGSQQNVTRKDTNKDSHDTGTSSTNEKTQISTDDALANMNTSVSQPLQGPKLPIQSASLSQCSTSTATSVSCSQQVWPLVDLVSSDDDDESLKSIDPVINEIKAEREDEESEEEEQLELAIKKSYRRESSLLDQALAQVREERRLLREKERKMKIKRNKQIWKKEENQHSE